MSAFDTLQTFIICERIFNSNHRNNLSKHILALVKLYHDVIANESKHQLSPPPNHRQDGERDEREEEHRNHDIVRYNGAFGKRILSLAVKRKALESFNSYLSSIGGAYSTIHRNEEAKNYALVQLRVASELNHDDLLGKALLFLAIYMIETGQFHHAKELLTRARALLRSDNLLTYVRKKYKDKIAAANQQQ